MALSPPVQPCSGRRGDRRTDPRSSGPDLPPTDSWPTLNSSRTRQLAQVLQNNGLGAHPEGLGVGRHESHEYHLAIYSGNGNEYLER
jgi:hypothetical protein